MIQDKEEYQINSCWTQSLAFFPFGIFIEHLSLQSAMINPDGIAINENNNPSPWEMDMLVKKNKC